MVAWKEVDIRSRGIPKLTIRKTAIAFSAYFIVKEGLTTMKYLEIFEDPEMMRVGFKFSNELSGPNLISLKQDGGRKGNNITNGRIAFVELLKIEWVNSVINGWKHCFTIQCDKQNKSYNLFYIELGYSFSERIDFDSVSSFPEVPGVYRLYGRKNELLRIGEGQNIKARLLSHKKSSCVSIYSFDFCQIQEAVARKKEEKRLFMEFKRNHNGFLPELNAITA